MEFEKIIKQKTNEMVEKMRNEFANRGQEFTERDELMFRMGVTNAFPIISIGLASTDISIAFTEDINK